MNKDRKPPVDDEARKGYARPTSSLGNPLRMIKPLLWWPLPFL